MNPRNFPGLLGLSTATLPRYKAAALRAAHFKHMVMRVLPAVFQNKQHVRGASMEISNCYSASTMVNHMFNRNRGKEIQ